MLNTIAVLIHSAKYLETFAKILHCIASHEPLEFHTKSLGKESYQQSLKIINLQNKQKFCLQLQ